MSPEFAVSMYISRSSELHSTVNETRMIAKLIYKLKVSSEKSRTGFRKSTRKVYEKTILGTTSFRNAPLPSALALLFFTSPTPTPRIPYYLNWTNLGVRYASTGSGRGLRRCAFASRS
jgi:hypothetical protein